MIFACHSWCLRLVVSQAAVRMEWIAEPGSSCCCLCYVVVVLVVLDVLVLVFHPLYVKLRIHLNQWLNSDHKEPCYLSPGIWHVFTQNLPALFVGVLHVSYRVCQLYTAWMHKYPAWPIHSDKLSKDQSNEWLAPTMAWMNYQSARHELSNKLTTQQIYIPWLKQPPLTAANGIQPLPATFSSLPRSRDQDDGICNFTGTSQT